MCNYRLTCNSDFCRFFVIYSIRKDYKQKFENIRLKKIYNYIEFRALVITINVSLPIDGYSEHRHSHGSGPWA